MTKADKMFLAALVASHKAFIAKESKSDGEYSKRAAHADRVAREIERHFSRHASFSILKHGVFITHAFY